MVQPMGDVVRPNVPQNSPKISEEAIADDGRPLSFYRSIDLYRVAFCKENHSSTCNAFRIVTYQHGNKVIYLAATVPATESGRIEAQAIATSVLQILRLGAFFVGAPV